jgi:hypothetical protein
MKQYLLAGAAALLVNAYASDNPFDLRENFGKLEQDEQVLLNELKRLSELKELEEEKELDEAPEEQAPSPKGEVVTPDSVQKMVDSVTEVVEAEEAVIPNRKTEVKEEALLSVEELVGPLVEETEKAVEKKIEVKNDESPEPLSVEKLVGDLVDETKKEQPVAKKDIVEETPLSVEKLVGDLVDPAQEAKEKELAAKEAVKKEAERREVEAYEKKRAAKLATQKTQEPSMKVDGSSSSKLVKETSDEEKASEAMTLLAAAAKEVGADVTHEDLQKAVAPKVNKEKKSTKKPIQSVIDDTRTSVDDINMTRERIEAKIAADKAYEEAVREMGQED